MVGAVSAFGAEGVDIDPVLGIRVDDGDISLGAFGECAFVDIDYFGGLCGHQSDKVRPVQNARLNQGLDVKGQSTLQARYPKWSGQELQLLLALKMRSVVGHESVDETVGDGLLEGLDVLCPSQRRIDLVIGVVLGAAFLGQEQMMRRYLTGNRQRIGLGGPDKLNRPGRGYMLGVVANPLEWKFFDELNVPP